MTAGPIILPDWLVLLVGRLVLEREAMARQIENGAPEPEPSTETEETHGS